MHWNLPQHGMREAKNIIAVVRGTIPAQASAESNPKCFRADAQQVVGAKLIYQDYAREQRSWLVEIFIRRRVPSSAGLSLETSVAESELMPICSLMNNASIPAVDRADGPPLWYHARLLAQSIHAPIKSRN